MHEDRARPPRRRARRPLSRAEDSPPLDEATLAFVLAASGASRVDAGAVVQPLWGGFGRVQRVALSGGRVTSAMLKLIDTASGGAHPRGWDGETSTRRKRESYAVEARFYERYASRCDEACRVPTLLGAFERGEARGLLLEDLDVDLPTRRTSVSVAECMRCLEWLAAFHARFLGDPGTGLWPTGCYWQLGTRADEFAAMPDSPVKRAAHRLDEALSTTRFRTLVHGDAKIANFCFDPAMRQVAALDFQYVGGGCGMRDVVYLLGSCLADDECRRHETALLDAYFAALARALAHDDRTVDAAALEAEWRALYAVAWTDFLRFLLGWMPTHRKISSYALDLAERALTRTAGT